MHMARPETICTDRSLWVPARSGASPAITISAAGEGEVLRAWHEPSSRLHFAAATAAGPRPGPYRSKALWWVPFEAEGDVRVLQQFGSSGNFSQK